MDTRSDKNHPRHLHGTNADPGSPPRLLGGKSPVLDEKYLKFQANLPSERKKDFGALCHTLIEYYCITTSYYRTKWRDLLEIQGESGQEIMKRVDITLGKWMRQHPADKTSMIL